jgi:hypothetical protein
MCVPARAEHRAAAQMEDALNVRRARGIEHVEGADQIDLGDQGRLRFLTRETRGDRRAVDQVRDFMTAQCALKGCYVEVLK